jgi:hypothetical protein
MFYTKVRDDRSAAADKQRLTEQADDSTQIAALNANLEVEIASQKLALEEAANSAASERERFEIELNRRHVLAERERAAAAAADKQQLTELADNNTQIAALSDSLKIEIASRDAGGSCAC